MNVVVYTDGSAIPNPGIAGYGFFATTSEGDEFNGYGPVGLQSTNNAAELLACYYGLKYFIEYHKVTPIEKFTIIGDSKYLIDNVKNIKKWENAGWKTSTGSSVANVDIWKKIYTVLTEVKERGISIEFCWTKGHSGNSGNIQADRNANLGRLALTKGDDIHRVKLGKEEIDEFKPVQPVKKTKALKAGDKLHPMIFGKKIFFITDAPELPDNRHYYFTLSYDSTLKNYNFCKRSSDTCYGILFLEEPISEIDSIKERFLTTYPEIVLPILIDIPAFTKADNWSKIVATQNEDSVIKGNDFCIADGTVVAKVVFPPKTIYRLEKALLDSTFIEQEIERTLKEQSTTSHQLDITDYFISLDKKGNQVINPEFKTDNKFVDIENVEFNGNKIPFIRLALGIDLPPRTNILNMTKCLKDGEKISITLFITSYNNVGFTITTMFKYGNNTGIYYAPDARKRIIPKSNRD